MNTYFSAQTFQLGPTVITANALDRLHPGDVCTGLRRHALGDWGDLGTEDKAENDRSLVEGCRLLSAYHDRYGTKFMIITEADRSTTTVLLPEDY